MFSCRLHVSWSDIHTLETSFSPPGPQNGLLFHRRHYLRRLDANHTLKEAKRVLVKAHRSPAGGKCYVCMQPGVYSVLLSEFTKGVVSDLTMSYFSQR